MKREREREREREMREREREREREMYVFCVSGCLVAHKVVIKWDKQDMTWS